MRCVQRLSLRTTILRDRLFLPYNSVSFVIQHSLFWQSTYTILTTSPLYSMRYLKRLFVRALLTDSPVSFVIQDSVFRHKRQSLVSQHVHHRANLKRLPLRALLTDSLVSFVIQDNVFCHSTYTIGEKEAALQEIRSGFEFVPGLFGIVLRGGYLYGAWPCTVLILIKFKFMVPEWWQLVVLCTCRILPEGLIFVENFPLRKSSQHRRSFQCAIFSFQCAISKDCPYVLG